MGQIMDNAAEISSGFEEEMENAKRNFAGIEEVNKKIQTINDSVQQNESIVRDFDHVIGPVSYTHLDVYKRQWLHRVV